jgi:hypothetical protein
MYGFRPTSDFCKKNMEIIEYLMELLHSDDETRKILERWAFIK